MEQLNKNSDTKNSGTGQDETFVKISEDEYLCSHCGVIFSLTFLPSGLRVLTLRFDTDMHKTAAASLTTVQ